jgi:hypothetical protein
MPEKKLFWIVNIIYLLSGLGHLAAHFFAMNLVEESFAGISLKLYNIGLLMDHRSLYDFLNGFSLTMGLSLAAIGILNLTVLYETGEAIFRSRLFLLVNTVTAVLIAIVSFTWFPLLVIIFYSVISSLLAYLTLKTWHNHYSDNKTA